MPSVAEEKYPAGQNDTNIANAYKKQPIDLMWRLTPLLISQKAPTAPAQSVRLAHAATTSHAMLSRGARVIMQSELGTPKKI